MSAPGRPRGPAWGEEWTTGSAAAGAGNGSWLVGLGRALGEYWGNCPLSYCRKLGVLVGFQSINWNLETAQQEKEKVFPILPPYHLLAF